MKRKELFDEVLNDYISLCEIVNGKEYSKTAELLPVHNFCDDYYDINFGAACFTVECDEERNGLVNKNSIEVWDDNTCSYIGTYTLEEIKEGARL